MGGRGPRHPHLRVRFKIAPAPAAVNAASLWNRGPSTFDPPCRDRQTTLNGYFNPNEAA
jgi:hypothetical protein